MIVAIAIPTLVAAVWLAVRWRLVVPVVLCESVNSLEVLRSSARLVRGNWRRTATAWLVTVLVVLCLGLLAAWLGRLCSLGAVLLAGNGVTSHSFGFRRIARRSNFPRRIRYDAGAVPFGWRLRTLYTVISAASGSQTGTRTFGESPARHGAVARAGGRTLRCWP